MNSNPALPRRASALRSSRRVSNGTGAPLASYDTVTDAPLDQLAISPQCGFSSDVVGNLISEDDQKRKLEIVVETARQVWG